MKTKRFITLALCLVLLAGLLPMTALADEEDWALLIDGQPVRSANADDILGNGVFSYLEREERVSEGTAICKYLLIRGSYTGTSDRPLIENRKIEGLRIKVDLASELTAAGTVISVGADTTLMGFAGLTLNSEAGSCIEVHDGKTLTLHGVDLKAQANKYALSGSETEESLVVAASILELHSAQGAVRGFTGGITLHKTCYYKEPDGAQSRDGAIKEKYNIQDPLHVPEVLNELLIYTYADLNADGEVTIDDMLQFIVFVVNDKELMMAITLAYMGYPTVLEKYDFDLNGQNGRQDFQFFIDRLFPDGTVYRVVLGAYNADDGHLLKFLAFQNIAEISLDAMASFVMQKNEFRLFIIDRNAVPLCEATRIDRTNAE